MGGWEGGQEGGGWEGVDGNGEGETGRLNLEGGNGEGEMWRGAIGTGRAWQWGGGQREEEMERGAVGKRGEEGEGARGGEISQMDMIGCLGGHRL